MEKCEKNLLPKLLLLNQFSRLTTMAGLRFSAAVMACVLSTASAVPNGLGMTPPLAWSSWNYFVSDPSTPTCGVMKGAQASDLSHGQSDHWEAVGDNRHLLG